jgi:hypothetical protein
MNIKKILSAIGNAIASIFQGAEHELEKVILPAAIAVTNAVKAIISVDTADIIGHIAGAAGAALEDKVRQALDVLVPKLQLAQQFIKDGTSTADILASIVKLLGTSDAVTKSAFYIEFSGLVGQYLADGELTTGEAVLLAQYYYANAPGVAHTAPSALTAQPPTDGTN